MMTKISDLKEKTIHLCQQRAYDEAYAILDAAEVEDEAAIFSLKAYLEKNRGNTDQALFYYTKTLEIQCEEPCYWVYRSWLYLEVGRPQEAYNDAEAALVVGQKLGFSYYDSLATFFCAQSLFEMGQYREALAYALKLPDDFRMWVNRLHTKEELVQACQAHLAGRD